MCAASSDSARLTANTVRELGMRMFGYGHSLVHSSEVLQGVANSVQEELQDRKRALDFVARLLHKPWSVLGRQSVFQLDFGTRWVFLRPT